MGSGLPRCAIMRLASAQTRQQSGRCIAQSPGELSVMSIANANRHIDLSRRLLEQANYELHTMADRVQASDKASGAVAQAVKAIAEDRNWRHRSHNLRRDIVGLLSDEYQRPQMLYLQAIADQLHDNYYEDWLGDSLVTRLLAEVNSLLPLLWEARERGENRDFTPSPAQQRIIDRLLLSEAEALADESIDLPPPMPPFNPPTPLNGYLFGVVRVR